MLTMAVDWSNFTVFNWGSVFVVIVRRYFMPHSHTGTEIVLLIWPILFFINADWLVIVLYDYFFIKTDSVSLCLNSKPVLPVNVCNGY